MHKIFVKLLRLQYLLNQNNMIFMARLLHSLIRMIFSADIGVSFNVPPKIFFPHCGIGVIIHSSAKIGNNCKIGAHVIIGNTNKAKHPPIIKENCTINARAMIIGETILENNCTVGAGAIVFNKIIPSNSIILGPFGQTREKYIQSRKVVKGH